MDENGKDVDETRFRRTIDSLIYLTSSRFDIVQSVGVCSKFQSHPKESHLSTVKRIIRYIYGTSDFGLWYPKFDEFDIVGYCDADFAGDRIDRRSTIGICYFLRQSLNVWSSKKQATVTLSVAEAKYIALPLFSKTAFISVHYNEKEGGYPQRFSLLKTMARTKTTSRRPSTMPLDAGTSKANVGKGKKPMTKEEPPMSPPP
ncbi:uncharacterized protein LOC107610735 [Arachis ipaensis]|uniref:uncharacterized protein LOC107610735 n=1 Tax=Arachis ipaensis TaxID=130454 RepID=UPI0007AFCEA1|nr:uncharacterized protein LOC107610735 [Arachis ipaensis]XP_025670023.1 uncharacterized protein LOC112769770 [Arachis hypogaea]